jgi:hypothetical protein
MLQSLYVDAPTPPIYSAADFWQGRQGHSRAPKVGRDRVQGPSCFRRSIHEHPAQQHGGIHQRTELGTAGTGADKVRILVANELWKQIDCAQV